jgi:hypothetical protein
MRAVEPSDVRMMVFVTSWGTDHRFYILCAIRRGVQVNENKRKNTEEEVN